MRKSLYGRALDLEKRMTPGEKRVNEIREGLFLVLNKTTDIEDRRRLIDAVNFLTTVTLI